MKIGITVQGDSADSSIDPRFGRAQGFVITDEQGTEFEYVDNDQNLNAPSGAGIQAAQKIIDLNVEVVITGNCGPKAFSVLSAGGVQVFTGATGTAKEVLDQYNKEQLQRAERPSVEGHWV